MILNALNSYMQALPRSTRYHILESWKHAGHEVAWLEITLPGWGAVSLVSYRELACECRFTEGIGWRGCRPHGIVHLSGEEECIHLEAVRQQRQQALAAMYRTHYGYNLTAHGEEIMLDMIHRLRQGEMIDGGWANNHGGPVLRGTFEAVFGDESFLPAARKLARAGHLKCDWEMITLPYRQRAASWRKILCETAEDRTATAYYRTISEHNPAPNWKLVVRERGVIIRKQRHRLSTTWSPLEAAPVSDTYNVSNMLHAMLYEQ